MKQWKTLIVEDERFARIELNRLLEDYDQINVVGEASSVKEASQLIEMLSPELIFLDIDLGTHTGFDLLEMVEPTFHTIFVTAFDNFAIRAFEVNALDYLLKPINPSRLSEAIARLGNPLVEKQAVFLKPYDKILIHSAHSSRFITVNSIEFIEANGDYTNIYCCDGVKGILHQTIAKWVMRLPSSAFVRVHRSYIININHIDRIQKKENGLKEILTEFNKRIIPLSRKYSPLFLERYKI